MKPVAANNNIKSIYQKFQGGDKLSDQEISIGIDHFKRMANDLGQCGPNFHLAWLEANRVYTRLEEFQTERNHKRAA